MRTLKSQFGWCVRVQWTLAVAMLVLAAGFYLFWYRPGENRLRDLKMQIEARQRELGSNQARASQLPEVTLAVDKLRVRLERFDKKLPKQQELGQFIKDITTLSRHSSLRKIDVRPGPAHRTELYSELPISFSFEGDFMDVFSFIRQTEDMQRLTRVRSVEIKNHNNKPGEVEVQLSMTIYFSEG
jgi:Tfp pilus assembly protein PilO